MKNVIYLTICFTFITLSGCMTMQKPNVDLSVLKSPGPVTSVVAAWEPAISNGENSERGFGGRVYFYDSDNRPVKIKGTVVVYAFDEDGRSEWNTKPNEGYVFDNKTLNSKGVYEKSKLGHSYKLWIPIESAKPGNPARKISLIVRFIPDKGSPPQPSSQATVHLPGRQNPKNMIAQSAANEWNSPYQQTADPITQQARMLEDRMLEARHDRIRTMQSATIR